MSVRSFAQRCFGLSSRIALLFGLGALSVAAAKAAPVPTDDGKLPAGLPQQSAKTFGETRVWTDGGRIYTSEAGGEARELQLGNTPEARHLRQLLQHNGAVPASPTILPRGILLAGGGGDGFHWAPPRPTANSSTPAAPTASGGSAKPRAPASATVPLVPKASAATSAHRSVKD